MNYNWDKKDFENSLKKLEHLLEIETDVDKKYYIGSVLAHEKNLLFSNFSLPLVNSGTIANSSKLLNIATNLAFYYRNYNDLEEYYKMLEIVFNSKYSLDKNANDFWDSLNKRYITHDELFEIAKSIIGDLDNDFYKCFLEFYNDRFKSIMFYNDDHFLALADVNGESNYIDIINKVYIMLRDSIGVNKIACFMHECGHITSMHMNPQKWHLCDQSFYDEVEAIFFELVSMYELRKDFSTDEINIYLYDFLLSKLETLNILTWQETVVNLWQQNNFVYNDVFLKNLKKETGLTKADVLTILNTSIMDDGAYIISYTIAIKLFNIYKQDKKEAVKLLKRIMLIPYNKIIEKEIKKIVNVDESLITESMKIVEDTKLTLKKNGYSI